MTAHYNANPNLKGQNVPIHFNKDQLDEWIKCAEDVEYFTRKYVKIVNVDHGLIPFNMYDYQANMINTFAANRFVICMCARQTGKSTTVTSYFLHAIIFSDNQNIAILANKGTLARDLLEKVKLAYEHLPSWLQQGIKVWNKGNIELENGSKIMAAATSSSAIRGGSFTKILLDEFAFVPRNLAEQFFTSVYPTISSGKTTQIIIVSTPYGMNHFFKMWHDAVEKRSLYVPVEVDWRQVPGHDEAWRQETIRNTSEEQFRQEFENQFIGSTNTLIHPQKLREMTFVTPCKDKWGLDVYDEPIKGHVYTITADTSHGVGGDYSAFCIVDVTQLPYKLVAKYKDNKISPMIYPEVLYYYGNKYNTAAILVETNDIGQQVVEALHMDLEYDNVLSTITKGRAGQRISSGYAKQRPVFGVRTTTPVKRIGCSNLKDIIENDKLLTTDYDLINEFTTFIQVNNSYEAEEGYHDDIVMCLVLFGWMIRQPFFNEITSANVRNLMAREEYAEMIEDVLPAGFIDDGQSDIDTLDKRPGGDMWTDANRW